MKREIVLEKPVVKFLQKHTAIAERFFEKIEIMEQNIHSPLLDIKKLQGTQDRHRLRIGKYRFLFRSEEQRIIIYFYDADSRGGIY